MRVSPGRNSLLEFDDNHSVHPMIFYTLVHMNHLGPIYYLRSEVLGIGMEELCYLTRDNLRKVFK